MVAAFSAIFLFISMSSRAGDQPSRETETKQEKKFDAAKTITEHVKDGHSFHFFKVGDFHAVLPLPVILYSPQRGWTCFSSARFGHEEEDVYQDYKMENGVIIPIVKGEGVAGKADPTVKVYDISMTRNVVQMILSLVVLVLLMTGIAKKYKQGHGVTSSPKGWQNAIEPVITFVRDDVAKPNLGHSYKKYMPYLLTVFFFILINSLFGLLPASANVTGNTAFTAVLGIISLVVILGSSNKHFWGHIFWPPGVPFLVKVILVPVELAGVLLIKPAALIIRLFANMIAGHIIILSFICLIFIFGGMSKIAGWGFSPISILFTVFIYLIEILIAFIQAYIFTNLTAVFIGQAFEGSHTHEDVSHGPNGDSIVI